MCLFMGGVCPPRLTGYIYIYIYIYVHIYIVASMCPSFCVFSDGLRTAVSGRTGSAEMYNLLDTVKTVSYLYFRLFWNLNPKVGPLPLILCSYDVSRRANFSPCQVVRRVAVGPRLSQKGGLKRSAECWGSSCFDALAESSGHHRLLWVVSFWVTDRAR